MNNFRPKEWNYNGPKLLTHMLENHVCHTSLAEMTPHKCGEFKVFPVKKFYPINYDNWEQLFNAKYTEKVLRAIENATTIHFWNNLTRDKILIKSKIKPTAYETIAAENCPTAFKASGAYF